MLMSSTIAAHEYLDALADVPRGTSLLRESDLKAGRQIAQAVGYDSDGAFHKAFKRILGVAPGEYRRSVAAGG